MKVLFLAIQSKYSELVEEPGLASLASFLDCHGHFSEVRRHFYENSIEELCEYINSNHFNLVGITTYDRHFPQQIACAQEIKLNCGILMCLGGYTASYNAETILRTYDFVDFVVRGEGELPILALADGISAGIVPDNIPGLCYKKGDQIHMGVGCSIVKDLDSLPFANRDLLVDQNSNLFQLTTSRGCTSSCSFCCSNSYWRDENNSRRFRCMSPKRVVDEIQYVVEKFGKTRIAFTDNSFEDPGNNIHRQREIAALLVERNLKVGYNINYRVNFHKVATPEFMKEMISSGLCSVFLGIESGNQFDLDLYNKKTTVADCRAAVSFFKQFRDLCVMIGFISLNPYSTKERVYENILFLRDTGFASDLSNITCKLTPYKGTAIFEQIRKDGLLVENNNGFTHSFTYLNQDINAFERHYAQIVRKYKALKQSRYLCGVLPSITTYLKYEARNQVDDIAYQIVAAAESELSELSSNLNVKNTLWMSELLFASASQYERISTYYIENEKIEEMYQKMMQIRNRLYRDLVRHNKKYILSF